MDERPVYEHGATIRAGVYRLEHEPKGGLTGNLEAAA